MSRRWPDSLSKSTRLGETKPPAAKSPTAAMGAGRAGAFAGALEARLGRADERARDHAADVVRIADLSPDPAQLIEPLQPEGFLVGCDLQHAVDRGVEDRFAGAH